MREEASAQNPLLESPPDDHVQRDELLKWPWSTNHPAIPVTTCRYRLGQRFLVLVQLLLFLFVVLQFIIMYKKYAVACSVLAVVGGEAAIVQYGPSSSSLPDYLVTKPELFPGRYDIPRWSIDVVLY